ESRLLSLSAEDVAVWSLQASAARHIVGISLLALGIAHQEQVDVVGLKRRVERRREMLSRTHRPDEMRRDDDDKIGLVLLEVGGAKKRAKDWQVANPGQLIDGIGRLRLEQAGNGEALSVPQFDRGVRLALSQGRDRRAVYVKAIGRIHLGHRRVQLQIDNAVVEHGGGEIETDAVLLPFDRDVRRVID